MKFSERAKQAGAQLLSYVTCQFFVVVIDVDIVILVLKPDIKIKKNGVGRWESTCTYLPTYQGEVIFAKVNPN